MAFFSRHKSEPQLVNMGENTYVIVGLRSPTDDEDDEDEVSQYSSSLDADSLTSESMSLTSPRDGVGNYHMKLRERLSAGDSDDFHLRSSSFERLSSEDSSCYAPSERAERPKSLDIECDLSAQTPPSGNQDLLNVPNSAVSSSPSGAKTPDSLRSSTGFYLHEYAASESEYSPKTLHRLSKKKRRAPLPPNYVPSRHGYAVSTSGDTRLKKSTDSQSINSESRLFYQTSTDSEPAMPESAKGSNFAGDLAGIEHVSQLRPGNRLQASPRERSRLMTFLSRSPQVGRKKSKKFKGEYKLHKSLRESRSKSPSSGAESDMAFEMSDTVFGCIHGDVDLDHEFEVKRVPDFDKYLSALLEETDPSHYDYEDLCRAAKRVRAMVKEREDELYEQENCPTMASVQERFPQDDLRLTPDMTTTTSSSSSSNNNNGHYPQHPHHRDLNTGDDNNNNNNNNNTNTDDNSGELVVGASGNKGKSNKSDVSESWDKSGSKSKGLSLRRKSAPSAVLFKSISGSRSKSATSLWSNAGMGKRDSDHVISSQSIRVDSDSSRMYLMEGSVQLATSMQIQERYMFLFTDLLLVAKQKSSTAFKLKHRIQLCDMWIASCIDEVCEITRPTDRSFVIGWPTTNTVVTFPTVDAKEKWLRTLVDGITKEKLKDEGAKLQMKVAPRDIQSAKAACQMTINNETKADDVLVQCLKQMTIAETDAADYQLWVSSGKEGTAYPLIGHETPFSIKRSQIREVTRSKSRDDISNMTAGDLHSSILESGGTSKEKCDFYIKQKKGQKKTNLDDPSLQKKSKFKSPNFLSKLASKISKPKPQIFEQPLADCFTDNNDPPEAIMKLMVLIYEKGPSFVGVMRRGSNMALIKEIREKIKSGSALVLEENHTLAVASVFKNYLSGIPGGLLTTKLRNQWMSIHKDDPCQVKIARIKETLNQLPPENYRLLFLTVCLLQHIAKHKDVNEMTPTNLAKCIAPSFCPESNPKQLPSKLDNDSLIEVQSSMMTITNIVTPLITFMIVCHKDIFGEDILRAFVPFGCDPSPQTPCLEEEAGQDEMSTSSNNGSMSNINAVEDDDEMSEEEEIHLQRHVQNHPVTRQSNSGTDSDSTHSVLSMADTGVMIRRDDSSVDSLVDREIDSSPTVMKSHLSPSNLSRDSGLTLSDTQLYDEEGDITLTGGKLYQRSSSHDDYLEPGDIGMSEPVPPPRSSRPRKSRGDYCSETVVDQQNVGSSMKPTPFVHSASTTALDFLSSAFSKSVSGNMNHPPLSKRISSNSIGEEEEFGVQKKSDFQRMQKGLDMGTLVKSASGTHLFLREDTQPSKYNLESGQRMLSRDRFMRQSSVTDSTPPVSPQSRYSYSSTSSFSMSQESLGHSAPPTPELLNDNSLSWSTSQDKDRKMVDPRLTQSLNINRSSNMMSKSTPNIAKDIDFNDGEDNISDNEDLEDGQFGADSEVSSYHSQYGDYLSDKYSHQYKSSVPWRRKSHEAEEVEFRRGPNYTLQIQPEEFNFEGKSNSLPMEDKHHSLLKGSPPPNILLKSLQTPSRRESVPAKGNEKVLSAIHRRSSADTVAHPPPTSSSRRISEVIREEGSHVKSKPIMISSPNGMDTQSSSSRAKLSKYVVPNMDLRPDKPPCYQQTLQRQFMLKQNVPIDIDMEDKRKQRENSYNARAMYEESIRLYNEQRHTEPENFQTSAKYSTVPSSPSKSNSFNSDFFDSKTSNYSSVISDNVKNSYSYSTDVLHSGGASKNLSDSSDMYDDSGASGFIDLGSISNNLQEDIIRRRNAHAGSGQTPSLKSQTSLSAVSISRTDSKLSDTGSSSGSSVTLSTLSRHSDSFSRRSDISNITVSSVSSSESSSDANSVMSRRKSGPGIDLHNMPYSRHFRHLEPENCDGCDQEEEYEEEYVTLRKDPQQVYQESKKLFEQRNSYSPPLTQPYSSSSLSMVPPSQSSSSTSSSSSTYSLTPRSNIDHFTESKPSSTKHVISKPTPQRVASFSSIDRTTVQASEPSQLNRLNPYDNQSFNPPVDSNIENLPQGRGEPQRKFSLTEMQSDEFHSNFLKTRSLFYNPDDDHSSSPAPSPRFPPAFPKATPPSYSPSTQNVSKNVQKENPIPAISDLPQKPTNTNSNSSNHELQKVPSSSSPSDNKELPWNVKKLKMLFDNSKQEEESITQDNSIGSIPLDSTSVKHSNMLRRNPPPYQNPPPFRRTQDNNNRASTSSNSSAGSEHINSKSSMGPYRHGPQASARDSFNSSFSSSEESYNSSVDRSSLQDSETISDYTNITYV